MPFGDKIVNLVQALIFILDTKYKILDTNNSMKFISLDIETTGFDGHVDDVIEFAAAIYEDGEIVDTFETLVKPNGAVPKKILAVTGINEEKLREAPTFDEVKDKIQNYVGDLDIIGHNIGFDLEFLAHKGIKFAGHKIDTWEFACTLLPKLPYYSLGYLAKILHLPSQPSHRALDDVLASVDLFAYLSNYVKSFDAELRTEIGALAAKGNSTLGVLFESTIDKRVKLRSVESIAKDAFADFDYDLPLKLPKVSEYDQYLLSPKDTVYFQKDFYTLQKQISASIAKAKITMVESGANIEPSLASLILAVYNTARSDEKTLIALRPSAFYYQDWPLIIAQLKERLPFEVKIGIWQGHRYELERKLVQQLSDQKSLNDLELNLLVKIMIWQKTGHQRDVYLSPDERSLWWQLAKTELSEEDLSALGENDVLITDQSSLLSQADLQKIVGDFAYVCLPDLSYLENRVLNLNGRRMTRGNFDRFVGSLRSFVRYHVESADQAKSGEYFRQINEVSGALNGFLLALSETYLNYKDSYGNPLLLSAKEVGGDLQARLGEVVLLLQGLKGGLAEFSYSSESRPIYTQVDKMLDDYLGWLSDLGKLSGEWQHYLSSYNDNIQIETIATEVGRHELEKLSKLSPKLIILDRVFDLSSAKKVLWPNQEVSYVRSAPPLLPEVTIDVKLPDSGRPEWEAEISQRLTEHLRERGGRTVVVLPNNKMHQTFFDLLWDLTRELKIGLVSPDTSGNALQIGEKFNGNGSAVLLSTAYHWQTKLSHARLATDYLIIAKLPFAPMSDPLLATRRANFVDDFGDFYLPRTITALRKIVAGNLNPDLKEIIFYDRKLIDKPYGQDILLAIEKGNIEI